MMQLEQQKLQMEQQEKEQQDQEMERQRWQYQLQKEDPPGEARHTKDSPREAEGTDFSANGEEVDKARPAFFPEDNTRVNPGLFCAREVVADPTNTSSYLCQAYQARDSCCSSTGC
jgi:hypothetical protein